MRWPERARQAIAGVLYAADAVLLAASLARGGTSADRRNSIPLPVRMASSALVLANALALWRTRQATPQPDPAPALAAAGMGCGFAGDLIMARVVPLPQHVLFGMLAFGAGHGLYIKALNQRARSQHLQNSSVRLAALGAAWAVAFSGWATMARNPSNGPLLNGAALIYALLLGTTTGAAAGLAAQDRRYLPLAFGSGLFLASDLILAAELFRDASFDHIGDLIWLTYVVGQALIVGTIGLTDTVL